jgi:L-alanine-DL-glutamate epimerase-like enolase superfamily enzyme
MSTTQGMPRGAAIAINDMLDKCVRIQAGQEVLILAYIDGLYGGDNLVDEQAVSWIQTAIQRTGGVTEWLKVAAIANVHNIPMAPHHDPQIHAHLVGAVPNGLTVETFPDAERDPIWRELLAVRPEIKNSYMEIPDRPGFGIELDEKVVAERGTKLS